jgi:hypothetical protein
LPVVRVEIFDVRRAMGKRMRQKNIDHFVCERRCGPLASRAKTAVVCGAASAALLYTMLGPSSAGTEVRGHADDIQLRAENASTGEILNALSAAFKLTYKLPPNIGRNMTGLYSGTLHQVLGRILDGNDYIVKVSNNGIEVVILGASGATAIVASGHAIARSENTIAPSPSVQSSKPTPSGSKPVVPASGPVLPASGPILPDSPPPPPLATYLSAN